MRIVCRWCRAYHEDFVYVLAADSGLFLELNSHIQQHMDTIDAEGDVLAKKLNATCETLEAKFAKLQDPPQKKGSTRDDAVFVAKLMEPFDAAAKRELGPGAASPPDKVCREAQVPKGLDADAFRALQRDVVLAPREGILARVLAEARHQAAAPALRPYAIVAWDAVGWNPCTDWDDDSYVMTLLVDELRARHFRAIAPRERLGEVYHSWACADASDKDCSCNPDSWAIVFAWK